MISCVARSSSGPIRSPFALLALTGILAVAACNADTLVSLGANERNRTLSASVGDQIDITLQSIGPGEYASPPGLSSPAVHFTDVADVGPAVPGGVTQRFRFRAASRGMAIIMFTHTGMNATVQDTVVVR